MTNEEINRIADAILVRIDDARAFRIPEEEHYNQHKELNELLSVLKNGRDFFIKGLAGLVAIGILVFAASGIKSGYWH